MIKSAGFCLALSLLALAAIPAHAAVTQLQLRTEGNSCFGADTNNVWGAINTSGAVETVVCSVTTNTLSPPNVLNVHVWDRNSNQAVICILYKKDSTGNPVQVGLAQSTTGTGLNTLSLGWSISGLQGYGLSLVCSVPPSDTGVTGTYSGVSDIQTAYFGQ
jgi:hypothetical protein